MFRRYLANRSGLLRPDADNKDCYSASHRTLRLRRESLLFLGRKLAMAKVTKLCVGESLVGDGNEVAHVDLLIGPRGSAAETAFATALTNNKDGFTALLAVV